MKLIYLANIRLPTEKAHGLQIMEMCQAFSQNGLDVELVIPRRFNYIKENVFNYYDVGRVFKITKLPCLDFIYLKFGIFGFWIESITFLLAARFYLFFRRYDILYTREIAATIFFNKVIVEIHSLQNRLVGFVYRQAQKVIVLTSFLKERLVIEAGLLENKILVAADGVDIQKFDVKETKEECRKKFGLSLEKKIVIYAGHLYKWKGADTLLEVATQLSNCLFVFVGGIENDLDRFRSLIKQKKINNVLLVGQRPHVEIPYYLKAADVLVLPNSVTEKISSHYTSPMKLFEYMASGVPIVASDLPSIREVLNEQNAVLVVSDDTSGLADGINRALSEAELSTSISEQALVDIKRHTWKKRAESIVNFLN